MHRDIWERLQILAGRDYDESIGDSIIIDKEDALDILNEIDILSEKLEEYDRLERDLRRMLGA